jgi:sugar (pentulose or hexulose) kinase
VPVSLVPPDSIELARAALESFAFGIRHSLERLDSFRGPALSIAIGGGMVRTKAFRNILADVLDCEIGIAGSGESTLLGALSQTAAGATNGPSTAEYAAIRATELTKYQPDATNATAYESLYDEWRHRERLMENFEVWRAFLLRFANAGSTSSQGTSLVHPVRQALGPESEAT